MESEETRAGLLQAVEIAVKDLEKLFCGEELTPRLWQVRYLCQQLDHILLYGLRTPLYGYWPFVAEFCHEETTREIISLPRVNSNLGYGRAWLLGALQSGLLVCYFQSFVYNRKLVNKYYLDNALLRDTLRLKVTIHYLARLSNLKFAFVTNDSSLDQAKFLSSKKGLAVADSADEIPVQNGAFLIIDPNTGIEKVADNNNLIGEQQKRSARLGQAAQLDDWSHSSSEDCAVQRNNYLYNIGQADQINNPADAPGGHSLTVQADVHLGVLDGSVSAGQKDQLDSLGGPHGLIGQDGLNGPDSLEQAVELDGDSDNVLAVLNELEMSNAERYDIAQLLAKESLLKFVEDLCKDEDGDSFYKVFLCYYYRVEQQHLSVIFLVLTTQRLLLLKTTDGYSLTQVASLPLLHIRQLRLAMDLQAIEIVWTSPREVFRTAAYSPMRNISRVTRYHPADCDTGEVVEGVGVGSLQLVMLSAEQCSWVVGHIELSLRRLGVRQQALPLIRHSCKPVTLLLKDWSTVRHVLWASCERFASRDAFYERHASIGPHGMIVSRLFYRLVPKRLPKRGMENTILWRSARFELKGASLEQYDLESDITPTAVYKLADPSCGGVQLCMENPRPFSFRVMWSTEPSLELAAESEFEFSEWLHTLLRSFQRYNKQSSSKGSSNFNSSLQHGAGGISMGASLCSIVLETNRLIVFRGSEALEATRFSDIISVGAYYNSFLVECRVPGSNTMASQQKRVSKIGSKKKGDVTDDDGLYSWIISFYGETEAQLFLEHLKLSHPGLTCRVVWDSITQSILCEPREKTFNQLCSYAAKFCDIIA
ncbi:uncharacterized protein LOC111261818 isoform X2 [Varroa jacobsoni]|uniref:RUN domain-containing protein n=1 Tax=Varroa destructor TaxID=109461 RepID=A0A7M7K0L9_VARDE|nr:uncharacterized protein LOC111249477 isoform X2 [Varroa destructor]XP_022691367.1 uncharacterized protein LOC111261818 isoform X2 [Varroa jacobsoni]